MTTLPTKVYGCTQFDEAGQCSAAVWVDQPAVLPPLSVHDGSEIGMKMFAAIVVVYFVRKIFNHVN